MFLPQYIYIYIYVCMYMYMYMYIYMYMSIWGFPVDVRPFLGHKNKQIQQISMDSSNQNEKFTNKNEKTCLFSAGHLLCLSSIPSISGGIPISRFSSLDGGIPSVPV